MCGGRGNADCTSLHKWCLALGTETTDKHKAVLGEECLHKDKARRSGQRGRGAPEDRYI